MGAGVAIITKELVGYILTGSVTEAGIIRAGVVVVAAIVGTVATTSRTYISMGAHRTIVA